MHSCPKNPKNPNTQTHHRFKRGEAALPKLPKRRFFQRPPPPPPLNPQPKLQPCTFSELQKTVVDPSTRQKKTPTFRGFPHSANEHAVKSFGAVLMAVKARNSRFPLPALRENPEKLKKQIATSHLASPSQLPKQGSTGRSANHLPFPSQSKHGSLWAPKRIQLSEGWRCRPDPSDLGKERRRSS